MIEIIIVDDEMLSRIGIQSLLDGVRDIHVAQTFDNAREALTYLERKPADILLTDLEMTGMHGMDLIREVKKRYEEMGILILSCHNDFSYAREALMLDADGYLLKHELNTELLEEEIRKIYHKKAKKRLGDGPAPNPGVAAHNPDLLYRVGVLRFWREPAPEGRRAESEMDRTMAVHFLDELLSRYDIGTLFAPSKGDMFIVFQMKQSLPQSERQNYLTAAAARLKTDIERVMSFKIVLGISREFADTKEIPVMYREASRAADDFFRSPGSYLFFYQEKPADEIERAMDYIEERLEQNLTLAEIAGNSNMSVPNFCKKFKARTGKTLVQYVNERKVESVKGYLCDNTLSLSEIAEKTGFSNENYMVRVFKKVTGMTVTDYRRQ